MTKTNTEAVEARDELLERRVIYPKGKSVVATAEHFRIAKALYEGRPFAVRSRETTMGAQIAHTFDWDGAPAYYQTDLLELADFVIASPTAKTEPSAAGLEDMRHLLDRDRYIVAIALGHIKRALNGHRWLLEGRGPYEWDDDRYRDEFADWVANVEAATGLLAKLAWDKDACETEADKVAAAREAARVYAVDPPVGHRTMLPSDLGLPCPSCAALSTPTRERDLLAFIAAEMRAQEDCNTGRYDEWLTRIDNLLKEGSGQ